jgi:hypothetical protein
MASRLESARSVSNARTYRVFHAHRNPSRMCARCPFIAGAERVGTFITQRA